MVFSSVLFLFRFLPIFMICYFLVPRKMKNLVLFLGSLVFYAWGEPVYIRFRMGEIDRGIQRKGLFQDLFVMFHSHQSFYPGIF